jgi:hypothetical protein
MDIDPGQALPYAGLIRDYMDLNRFAEARIVYQQAQARNVDAGEVQRTRYLLAFLENDTELMAQLVASISKQPGYEYRALLDESETAAYFGHLRSAREFSRRSADKALEDKDTGAAARVEADEALREELFGDRAEARRHLDRAMKLEGAPSFYAMALALSGNPSLATKVVDRIASQVPPGSFMDKATVPEYRGAIELARGNASRAIELLAPAESVEAGWNDLYLAAYLRGQAYLLAHQGRQAAGEFQKIVDHRGVVGFMPWGVPARLGLGRAYAVENDTTRARAAYDEFLTLWKDADADIPILKQAQAEYAKLRLALPPPREPR